ncbi:MAG TPA: hypothetical protein VIH98_09435 [Xanthobacteraceae bacterium]|jgi:hypothetical protein
MSKTGRPTHRRVVVLALLAGLIAAGHVGKLPPALPSIRADLGLDIITAVPMMALAFLLRCQEKRIAARSVVVRS